MEKSLSDILRDQQGLSESEVLQFARYLVRNTVNGLSINQLDRAYRAVREIARENEVAR